MSLPNLGIGADLNGAIPFSTQSEWNMRVDNAPVAANSAQIIAAISPEKGLHADFGAGLWEGQPMGIPYVVVPEDQSLVDFVETYWADEGDPGPFPIPADAPVEGGADHHVIVLQQDPSAANGLGKLYEIYLAEDNGTSWSGQAAVFDMQGGDRQRPDGWTSADAAGLPIFPGLARYDEVSRAAVDPDGTLGHALRFTLNQAHTATSYVGAASHYADLHDGPAPFGMHVRLREDFEIPADATPEVRVIINTLKKYGMIMADNGSDWFISGSPNAGWDDDALQVLSQVKGGDFEVIDPTFFTSNNQNSQDPGPQDPDPKDPDLQDPDPQVPDPQVPDPQDPRSQDPGLQVQGKLFIATQKSDTLLGKDDDGPIKSGTDKDKLVDGADKDKFVGGADNDIWASGQEQDRFIFHTALSPDNVDTIKEFLHRDDVIDLDDLVCQSIDPQGKLGRDAFSADTAAVGAENRIIHAKASGNLYYDSDGAGGQDAILFAMLANYYQAKVMADDFMIF